MFLNIYQSRFSYSKLFLLLLSCFILSLLIHPTIATAANKLYLGEVNPKTTEFKAYLSYKYKLLLVSLVTKNNSPNRCRPNRFILYDYGTENYFHLDAGELKLNHDFSLAFFTEVITIGGYNPKNKAQWVSKVETLMKSVNVSSATLESARLQDKTQGVSCWQQATVLNVKNGSLKKFPYLTSNLCKSKWCNDLFWSGKNSIRFWAQMSPKNLHLIELDVTNGDYEVKTKKPVFTISAKTFENAPRENIVKAKELAGKTINLSTVKKASISLDWKKQPGGNIVISLNREKNDPKVSEQYKKRADKLLRAKKYTPALRYSDFAIWLQPGNSEILVTKIKILGALFQTEEIFSLIGKEKNPVSKLKLCQTLHKDRQFTSLKKLPDYQKMFNKNCYHL